MSQSYTDLLVHIVFSTKDRKQLIVPKIEKDLHRYLIGISENHSCSIIEINSVTDHIHLLASLNKNISVSKFTSELKSNSSRWVKTQGKLHQDFAWQNGYGAFTISRRSINNVKKYIQNQKEHHNKISFKQEFLDMLNAAGIEHDDKYLWL